MKFRSLLSYVLVATLSAVIGIAIGSDPLFLQGGQSKLDQLVEIINACYVDEVDETAVEDAAAAAMVSSLGDRWSYYIPADSYADHKQVEENAYAGIGVAITTLEDGSGFEVTQVEPNGPAQEAGVLPGDWIIAIDGQSAKGMTTKEAKNLVRGKEGSFVSMTLLRGGEEITVSVERRRYETVVATHRMLDNHVGLVTIENFGDRCAKETVAAVETLLEEGAEALIFDVRCNPGGFADEMIAILDVLLPEGPLFTTVDNAGREETDYSDEKHLEIPMAVLVDRNSYSAAEFFAAALQEYGAAVIVGGKTSGKGYFQNTFEFPDGSAMNLSVGKYFTPHGNSLEGVGVTPDVQQLLTEEEEILRYYDRLEPGKDPQLHAALKALEK